MMIHAYQEYYLSSAQKAIGDAFDYAINTCKIEGSDFVKMFLASPISKKIENGEPLYLKGKSGIEIAIEIIEVALGIEFDYVPKVRYARSKEYWIGYAVTYYQWYRSITFFEIFDNVSFNGLEKMYDTMHEVDLSKFCEVIDEIIKKNNPETKLKRYRIISKLSQKELATRSGVSLRSIQMYEQKNKDINKASAETLYKLSKTLGCKIEDLLEKEL